MRRVEGLVEFSRRGFGAACLGIAVVACSDADRSAVGTGGLTGGPSGTDPDAPPGTNPDARLPIDAPAGSGATCPATGSHDVGAPSTYTLNTPKYNSSIRMFVVKDANGFYALTSLCTHEGAVCQVSSGVFFCPRHGAEFTFNGAIISGPVSRALAHYAMCTLANGNLGVVTGTTVSASTRLVA